MSHLLPILVVLIGLVTLFFADKRGNCVSEQTVISVAVVTWLFGYDIKQNPHKYTCEGFVLIAN